VDGILAAADWDEGGIGGKEVHIRSAGIQEVVTRILKRRLVTRIQLGAMGGLQRMVAPIDGVEADGTIQSEQARIEKDGMLDIDTIIVGAMNQVNGGMGGDEGGIPVGTADIFLGGGEGGMGGAKRTFDKAPSILIGAELESETPCAQLSAGQGNGDSTGQYGQRPEVGGENEALGAEMPALGAAPDDQARSIEVGILSQRGIGGSQAIDGLEFGEVIGLIIGHAR